MTKTRRNKAVLSFKTKMILNVDIAYLLLNMGFYQIL